MFNKHFLSKDKYKIGYIILSLVVITLSIVTTKTNALNKDSLEKNNSNIVHFYNNFIINPKTYLYKNSLNAQGGADFSISGDLIKVQGSSIISTKEKEKSDIKDVRDKIITYIVQEGDTVSKIAEDFGVSQNTIIWENDIKRGIIRIGQKLSILPVTGLKYKVKKGDTVAKIAKRYKVSKEEIYALNELEADLLKVGEIIIIPNGKKKIYKTIKRRASSYRRFPKAKRIRYTRTNYGWLTHPAPGTIRTQGRHIHDILGKKESVDMGGPIGTPILAAASGVVIKSHYGGWGGGYGNHIMIRHPNGVVTLYAHLSKNKV